MANWVSMFPTEASAYPALLNSDTLGNDEIAQTRAVLNDPKANSQDKGYAQQYLNTLLANGKEGGSPGATPKAPLTPSELDMQGYANNPTGSTATPEQQAIMQGGDGKNSPLEWIKAQMGNVGFVVLGVVVIGVALVAATNGGRKFVIESARAAAGA